MLARELGSGAFSVVKLGVHLVSRLHYCLRCLSAHSHPPLTGNRPEDCREDRLEEEAVRGGLRGAAHGDPDPAGAQPSTHNKVSHRHALHACVCPTWCSNICLRLYETFDEGSDFFIVTELVEGGELFDRIVSKAHYTEKEARDLIKIMLETMNYMHKQGVVHRDLKPENLLLCTGTPPPWPVGWPSLTFSSQKRMIRILR